MKQIFKIYQPSVFCLVLLFSLFACETFAQSSITVSGNITDAQDGESLIGANIYSKDGGIGTTSNAYGFYSISMEYSDSLFLFYSYLGYETQVILLQSEGNIRQDIEMSLSDTQLETVEITANPADENITRTQMSVLSIPTQKIKEIPAILGEIDVMKVAQLLPGVQAGNEGTSGFHVRGGNADQNLVLLDEAVIYNPNHLFGLFSTFNSRAINSVTLIKGGFPAQYGGRLSSVLDVSMKEGNNKKFGVEGGIGLVTSQLTLEGPIEKEKASFIVSARRSYYDWLIKPFLPNKVSTNYAFYDLNAKVNYKLSPTDRIYLSGYKGSDDAVYGQQGIDYNILFNNETLTLRWNHIFGPKLFSNTSLILNSYDQDISAFQDNAFSQVISGINDKSGKIEFQYFPDVNHTLRFGGAYMDHTFRSSGDSQVHSAADATIGLNTDSIPEKKFREFAFYLNDEIKLGPKLSTSFGVRFPGFFANEASYYRIEPRASIQIGLNKTSSIKAAYSISNQFIHLIPSSTASVPTEIWIPSTRQTKPQFSQQYNLGYFKNFRQNAFESSVEVYYKTMKNQVLFEEGNQLVQTLDVDDLLVYGKGWSYGAEFFLKKNSGRLSGWISYTLSWTYQQFEDLNFGEKFPFKYDRRHNLSLVASYQLNDHWTLSGTFVYTSGSAFTVPEGRVSVINGGSLFEGNYYIYQNRNNTRLNSFHRLNIAASWKKERRIFGKNYQSEWVFSLYNAYNRLNPYFIHFEIDPVTEKPKAKQVSLLPIIPSITFNFKF